MKCPNFMTKNVKAIVLNEILMHAPITALDSRNPTHAPSSDL